MFKYNSKNIFGNYIKQLLASFNLPTIRVITENPIYLTKGNIYILDNKIIQMLVGKFSNQLTNNDYIVLSNYKWGDRSVPKPNNDKTDENKEYGTYIPYTKKLQIRNNIYDSYTHKYLGDYLRFLRDYKKLDLMSLYNCFSNEQANDIDINYGTTGSVSIFKSDINSKIYVLPVRFFENYTIAIQSESPIEICCALYDKGKLISTANDPGSFYLAQITYRKIRQSNFNNPILYTNLSTVPNPEWCDKESKLCMFIKVPISTNSSIVVLEGNYLNYNDYSFRKENELGPAIKPNKSIINIDILQEGSEKEELFEGWPNYISHLQLLDFNSGISYPFADRLIEYLIGNVVDDTDKTADNVKRVQQLVKQYLTTHEIYNIDVTSVYGSWQPKLRYLLYSIATNTQPTSNKMDVLGYYDKDIEKLLGDIDIYDYPLVNYTDSISETKINIG